MIARILYIITLVVGILAILGMLSGADECFGESTSSWNKLLDAAGIDELHEAKDPNADMYIVKVEDSDLTFKSNVESFDVSEDRIVIAFTDDTLGIFDKKMNIVHSYKCSSSGTICGVLFKDDNILLFYARCNYVTEISQGGDFIALYDAPSDPRITKYAYLNTCVSDNCLYYVSDDKKVPAVEARWTCEPYLIRQRDDGEKELLYDSYVYHRNRIIVFVAAFGFLFIALLSLILFILFSVNKKMEKGELDPYWTEMHLQEVNNTLDMLKSMDDDCENTLISSSDLCFQHNRPKDVRVQNNKDSISSNPLENFRKGRKWK